MSAIVYWFETGKLLHRRADCPQLLQALTATRKATGTMGPLLSCDMDAEVMSDEQPYYPPDDLEPCSWC